MANLPNTNTIFWAKIAQEWLSLSFGIGSDIALLGNQWVLVAEGFHDTHHMTIPVLTHRQYLHSLLELGNG